MRPLTAHDLLEVWEGAEGQRPVDRALTLLAAACPESTRDELAALSIGQRDARLLTLRERTFGPRMYGFAECPKCAERLEFDVAVVDLRVAAEPEGGEEGSWELVAEDLMLRFRLPNSQDLAAAAGCEDTSTARELLVRRCVLQASRDGVQVSCSELPAEIIGALAQRMIEHDPQAEVLLDLRCPECDHRWQALFDIADFFWTELNAQARRLLGEICSLARAYGWREADILTMSARRRHHYLELVNA
jgi:hypothetical protein